MTRKELASSPPTLTRRELREQERAAAAVAVEEPVAATPMVTAAAVSSLSRPLVASVPVSSSQTKRLTRRNRAQRSLAITAMAFVAAIAVATSVPATAFTAPTTSAAAAAAFDEQQLTTASGGVETVSRDDYGISTIKRTSVATYSTAPTFTNNPRGTIQWPFLVGVHLSDGFGFRVAPCWGCSIEHKGQDFDAGNGAPIQIIADGVVRLVHSTDNGGLGVYVMIDHVIGGQKITSVYGHMITGSVAVTEGQSVKVGQLLGNVGDTGASTGSHLHLEIHVNDVPVDPFAWLKAHAN